LALEFLLLGPVEARRDAAPVDLGGPMRDALLALLLLHVDRVLSVDEIIDDLWGTCPPASARGRVHNLVHGLRQAIGQDSIETSHRSYRFTSPSNCYVDLRDFEMRLFRAREHRAAEQTALASAEYAAALKLWRGDPLAGVQAPFAATEAARLEDLRIAAVQENTDVELMLGQHRELLPALRELVHTYPLHEPFRAQLMLALYRCGRRADALDVYAEGRAILVEELGLDPGKELRQLQHSILRGDPSLDLPPVHELALRHERDADRSTAPRNFSGAEADHPRLVMSRSADNTLSHQIIVGMVALLIVSLLSVTLRGDTIQAAALLPQEVKGPIWKQVPTAVPPTYFGLTVASPTGAMPDFQVGAVRLWDSYTRWANVEPAKGRYDWTTLDRLVTAASAKGLPILYTLGGTPGWAAPNGQRGVYSDDSRTAPPDDLRDWTQFVKAVAQRYRGKIQAYELWNLANSSRYYSGTLATLLKMTDAAAAVIRHEDPSAIIACPGMGELWEDAGRATLRDFADGGGYQQCDVASIKLYPQNPGEAPETMASLAHNIDVLFRTAGTSRPIWNTGTTWRVAIEQPLNEDQAVRFATRFYLVGLYLRVQRMYFYSWGSRTLPIVLQADGGPPTKVALAVQEIQRWTMGRRLESCGSAEYSGLPAGLWQCTFRGPGREWAVIEWTPQGSLTLRAQAGIIGIQHVDGTSQLLRTGELFDATGSPILVRYTS
jgi:DNA-binding SARP family transcriptional activator